MAKNLTTLILKNNYPVLEYFITKIAQDYNLNVEELKKNYLSELKEYRKKRSRARGVLNGYSVFLADKEIDKKIRDENNNPSFGEISQIKGKMWKELPDSEKEKYKSKAKKANEQKAKSCEEEKSDE